MNVLLVGSGGREHALAWKISQSAALTRLYTAPGNPGTATLGHNLPIDATDLAGLLAAIHQHAIDLVVVGPEAALAAGLVDACQAAGVLAFGPTAAAAQIESSKAFAKTVMQAAGVPTANAFSFDDPQQAAAFVRERGQIWVVKVDGLAGGKGVIVPESLEQTLAAVAQLGSTSAGTRLLLEQKLSGPEVSVIALCDGERLWAFPPAQDHKRLLDGDRGPNTGGMGAFAPSPLVDRALLNEIVTTTMAPVVRELARRGIPFRGALFAGIMLTEAGPSVLEFNARFGDPETQALMPLTEGDLLLALHECAQGKLRPDLLHWREGAAACIVLAAAGYPEAPRTGDMISGIAGVQDGGVVFQAGTALHDGQLHTAGGRVLGVVGAGPTPAGAIELAYTAAAPISFDGMHYRTDIGRTREKTA
ncbi:MAG: phosphoribosylamine--glycine ligase [Roseiflexaceae bacterium]|nr:phosphoribosylamine--glycine ligase [Roseiflexaceae bacterium]